MGGLNMCSPIVDCVSGLSPHLGPHLGPHLAIRVPKSQFYVELYTLFALNCTLARWLICSHTSN